VSHSMNRRRSRRTFAATLALTLGSLAIPAAALADGQLDPTFHGTGYHVGTVAEGTVFNNTDTRIPMIVQANGSVVIGGSRGGFMTLARYTPAGALDTSFGVNGFATQQFAGTAGSAPGNSGATAMTQDAGGNIIVAGFGASQSMVAARFTANGAFSAASVCFAPHLIDYTARAVAVRPNGSVVLVGYARDRWPTVAVPPTPAVLYGQRAVVTLPASGVSSTLCGSTAVPEQGSAGVQIDGLQHDGTVTDATLSGRYYEGVAALPDNRYVVATTNGPDANVPAGNAAWLLRFPAAGAGLDTTFNPLGAGSIVPVAGRLPIPNVNLHAIKLQGTDAYAAGEALGGTADARRMLLARVDTNGAFVGGFGAGGIAQAKVSGGNNTGQALIFQATNVIVGGGANLAGKSAFGMTRFNAQTGAHDPAFGPSGQVVTPFGAPAVNGYITGMALSPQGMIDVSGRLTDPAGLATVAARYFAVGSPPPPPLPAASTMGADQVTGTSARISGTVNTNGSDSTWWIEYGTTTAYGAHTVPQALPASLDDVNVQGIVSGLATGTTYHARIVIASAPGADSGDDVAFTTAGTVGAGGATGGTTGGAATGGSKVSGGGITPATPKKKTVVKRCIVPKVTGKTLNKARITVLAKGCKVKVIYKKSHKKKGTVLTINRKVGKKLAFRALVTITVAKPF
jgi:uncharacterized delta-60 repeat protein